MYEITIHLASLVHLTNNTEKLGNIITVENVAINDVLPLEAARCDAASRRGIIANLQSFGAPRHQRLNFDRFIYINVTVFCHIIRLAS